MKSRLLLFFAFAFPFTLIFGQGEMDAYKLSRNELKGTARSLSMGGAFGALGGDVSAISINPAGIGVYKSSEIVTTLDFRNVRTESELNIGKYKENKFNVSFNNLAFVASFPVQSDDIPYFNFGFSYNKLKNFSRKYSVGGINLKSSLTDYMAYRAAIGGKDAETWLNTRNNKDAWQNEDWLAVLGYNGYLINETPEGSGVYTPSIVNGDRGLTADSYLFVQEKGWVDTYDFNFGTTISDIVSAGITVSVTDLNYRLYSSYTENFGATSYGFDLYNWLKTEGTGWQLSAGLIFKPVQELRIGIAYHSPTWYNMTDYFVADLNQDLSGLVDNPNTSISPDYKEGWVKSYDGDRDGVYDYEMRTPDKWTFSAAGIIGNSAIISLDYELTNYRNMKLFDRDGRALASPEWDPNGYIKEDFRAASTLRLGAEYRFTPQFSGRIGYAWEQSPLKKEFKQNDREVVLVGSIPHYTLDGNTNYFTYGLGYRFTRNFYADIAFVMSSQKSDLYSFPNVYNTVGGVEYDFFPAKSTLKTNTFQGLLTLGYKF